MTADDTHSTLFGVSCRDYLFLGQIFDGFAYFGAPTKKWITTKNFLVDAEFPADHLRSLAKLVGHKDVN